jgi:hypothetical protein
MKRRSMLLMNNMFNNMKKVELFFIKSLLVVFVCFSVIACNESSERVSFYYMAPVSKYEKETMRTDMYHDGRNVNEYNLFIEDSLTCKANVAYRADGIICRLNDIHYHIQPDNVLGATRVRMIIATKPDGLYHETEYYYDANERLGHAVISAPGVPGSPFHVYFVYYDSHIVIQEPGGEYRIDLCDEENTGYVCNVLSFAEAPLTSQYIINPDLYFLNIYGRPVDKLPNGHEIVRSEKTLRVGKHSYKYRD